MSIVSYRDLEAHEEVFVDYNYRLWQGPAWYQEQWIHHKRDVENVSEETLLEITRRINRQHGVFIEFPEPKRTSKRFQPCRRCKKHVSILDTAISCEECENWYHAQCTEIGLENMTQNAEKYEGWTCEYCNVSR